MIKTIEEFYTESEKYVALFNKFSDKHKLQGSALADHICYKCESKESFERLRTLLEFHSDYFYQSIISNRRITYIKLKKSIKITLGLISFLELSDQKPDGSQFDGFDHIEVYPTTLSYRELIKQLEVSEKVLKVERPHHTTHDIEIGDGFIFRCTQGPLIEKIKNTEMQ